MLRAILVPLSCRVAKRSYTREYMAHLGGDTTNYPESYKISAQDICKNQKRPKFQAVSFPRPGSSGGEQPGTGVFPSGRSLAKGALATRAHAPAAKQRRGSIDFPSVSTPQSCIPDLIQDSLYSTIRCRRKAGNSARDPQVGYFQ